MPRVACFDHTGRSVKGVTHHRMSKGRQVHPYLMSAPGINLQLQQCELAEDGVELAASLVVGHSFPSAHPPSRHAGASNPIAANTGPNCSVVLLQPSMHQRNVCLLRAPLRKLESQLAMGFVILGHHDEPAGAWMVAARPR